MFVARHAEVKKFDIEEDNSYDENSNIGQSPTSS